jgi:hypothetical protein
MNAEYKISLMRTFRDNHELRDSMKDALDAYMESAYLELVLDGADPNAHETFSMAALNGIEYMYKRSQEVYSEYQRQDTN